VASRHSDNVLRIEREDLDLDVELAPTVERTLGEHPRPAPPARAAYQAGSLGPDFVGILIDFEVLQEVWRHCGTTTSREVAGVLLGGVWRDLGGPYVSITRTLDARFTHERLSRVTFTHQTWQDLATRMDALGTDEVMIGWYHTHPGYGVFMSAYDQFIHQNFFGAYGVALVVDPVAGDCGFFENRDGAVTRVPGFQVLGRPGQERAMAAFMSDLRGTGRPLPFARRAPVEIAVEDLTADAEFQESQTAFRSFLRRFFGDLAPEPDGFSAGVTEVAMTLVARGKRLPPGEILKAIDRAVFDVSRDNRDCRSVQVRVRRGHPEGELVCTAEWFQPRRAAEPDMARQVLTPRMRAMVTWRVPIERLDITG
jgi:proteasome lid subunit RPN8/RPN11